MHPIEFPGSTEIRKPVTMKDEDCVSAWATAGIDLNGFPFYITCWQPNKEDIDAINAGRGIYVKTLSKQLPPMALFTLDENNEGNF